MSIPTANGNILISANGVANVLTVLSSGANITGNLSVSGNITATRLFGAANTVTTNAQPNITSVGTLTSLTVGPNSSVVLSGTSGFVKANSIQGLDGTNTIYMYYGNISGAVGIYGDLTIGTSGTGNLFANAGTSYFGNANTVKIQGGSNGYFLRTDGNGNLSWADVSSSGNNSSISNGNSNVSIATANGNINMAVSGNANLIRISGNGFFANTDIFNLQTRIVQQGGNPNGTQLSSDDGKDRGVILNYYETFPAQAFMGWDNSNGEIAMASEVTVSSDVVTIFALANVRANNFLGNIIGNISGNITSPGSNTQILYNDSGTIAGSSALTFNKTTNAVNTSSTFTANGTITGSNLSTAGNLSVTGNANVGNLDSFGVINAVFTITGGNFYSGGTIQSVGNATFGNIQTAGELSVTGNFNSGNLATTGGLSVLGNVSIGSLASNLLSVSSNYANFDVNVLTVGSSSLGVYLYPNGYARVKDLQVYSASGNPGNITASDISVTSGNFSGAVSMGSANISGNLNGNVGNFSGNVNGNVGNFSGNIIALNANLGNLATANFFSGDGYLLSNLTIPAGTSIENGNSNVQVTTNSNINMTVAGVPNVVVVTNNSIIVTGNANVTSNVSANNITLTNNVNANIINASTLQNANAVINLYNPNNVANAYVTIGTDASPSRLRVNNANVTISDLLVVNGNANVTTVNASSANITGNLSTGNATLGNLATANFFSGDGYLLTNLTLGAGTYIENGNSNVVVLANANVNISAEGNANVLVVTGNSVNFNKQLIANVANITTSIIATANISNLNLFNNFNADGNLFANGWANVTGFRVRDVTITDTGGTSLFEGNATFQRYLFGSYINVSSQLTVGAAVGGVYIYPNGSASIRNLSVYDYSTDNGTITTNEFIATTANTTTLNVSGNLNGNVGNFSGNLKTLNANLGNLVTANYFSGDGYLLTNLTIGAGTFIENGNSNVVVVANSNVTISSAGNANIVVVTGSGVNIAGTINATGNLTAGDANLGNVNGNKANFTGAANTGNLYVTGTFTSTGVANTGALTVNGNVTAANASLGNAVSANYFIGDGYLLSNLTIPAGTAIINGNSNVLVTYASDVNITANGVANVLKVYANATQGTITTGNAIVTGYVKAASFANGNSNIAISENGEIDMSVSGNTTLFKVTSVGANVYGSFFNIGSTTITGNANIANVGVSGLVTVAGNISGGNISTGGRLSVGGNSNVANVYATGIITAVSTVTGGTLVSDGNANVGATANVNALIVRSGGASVTGNLDVTGNVNVNGNLNYQNVVDLVVGDPLIFIGANNTGDIVDLGIVASYTSSGNSIHTGLARNYTNDYWTFFDGVDADPTTVIDWANATYPTVKLGNLVATSNGNFTGNVHASYFIGNVVGNIEGNLTGIGSNTQVIFNRSNIANGSANFTFDFTTGQVTVIGNIVGSNLITGGVLSVTGNANIGNIGTGGLITATGNVTGGNLVTSGALSVTGNANVGNLGTSGVITATGNITGNYFIGNGSQLTGIDATAIQNGTANVRTFLNSNVTVSASGNANILVITGTGANINGTLTTTGNITVGSGPNGNISGVNVLTATTLIACTTANFANTSSVLLGSVSNVKITGGSSGQVLSTDGSGNLSYISISTSVVSNGNSNVSIPSANGNINLSSAGNANILVVTGTGANITGTLNVTGNSTTRNITPATTDSFDLGTDTTFWRFGYLSLLYTNQLRALTANGNVTISNDDASSQWRFTDSGNLVLPGNTFAINYANGTAVPLTPSSLVNGNSNISIPSANGNINLSSAGNANIVVVTGTGANVTGTFNVTGNLISGNANLGNLASANFFSGTFNGSLANGNSNISIPSANGNVNISSAGNANILVVTGTGANITGTLNTSGNLTIGSATGGNISGANVITANTLIACTTANFANTSSVLLGNVSNVKITGGSSGQVLSTDGSGNLSYISISTASISNGNSNISIPSANGNVNISSAGNANIVVVTGTGANVTGTFNVTGNITGGNANLGNLVTANHFSGTVTTASQPNITSLGTLSSLTVGPNSSIILSGTSGFVKANSIQGMDGTQALYMYYGSVSGAVGVRTDLTVGAGGSGNLIANAGRAVFGDASTVTITGGSSGQVLSTDGAGNLSWVTGGGGGGGTPGGSNTQIQFNDAGSFGGNAGLTFNKSNTTLTANNFIATSTANLGNVGNVRITGGTANYFLKTDGNGNLSWAQTGSSGFTTLTVDNFTGNGVQTVFTLSVTPGNIDETMINIDGVLQLREAYSLSGANITFDNAPANGALIEVNIFVGLATGSGTFNTRNYTGNGVQTTFAITSGQTASSLLVAENGILQVPTTDYTVSGANLVFTTAPANGQAIQVREMSVALATNISPGGSNTQIQFNDSGNLAGNANLTFNKTTGALTVGGVVSAGFLIENSLTINANYTITAGKSAMSVGPINIANGVSVTVPTGSKWVIL